MFLKYEYLVENTHKALDDISKFLRTDKSKFMDEIIAKENCPNIIDINDAMEAYWLTAKRGKIAEIYNISGKKVISVGKYLKELKKLSVAKNIETTSIDVTLPGRTFQAHTSSSTSDAVPVVEPELSKEAPVS